MRDACNHDGLLPSIVREEDAPISGAKPPVAATRPLEPLDVAGKGVSLDLLDHPAARRRVKPLQVTKCPCGVRDAPFRSETEFPLDLFRAMHPVCPDVVPRLFQASLAFLAQLMVHFGHAKQRLEVGIRPVRQVLKVAHRSQNFFVRHTLRQANKLLPVASLRRV